MLVVLGPTSMHSSSRTHSTVWVQQLSHKVGSDSYQDGCTRERKPRPSLPQRKLRRTPATRPPRCSRLFFICSAKACRSPDYLLTTVGPQAYILGGSGGGYILARNRRYPPSPEVNLLEAARLERVQQRDEMSAQSDLLLVAACLCLCR